MTRDEALLMLQELNQELEGNIQRRSLVELKAKVAKAHMDNKELKPILLEALKAAHTELLQEEIKARRQQLVTELTINSLEHALTQGVDPRYDIMH